MPLSIYHRTNPIGFPTRNSIPDGSGDKTGSQPLDHPNWIRGLNRLIYSSVATRLHSERAPSLKGSPSGRFHCRKNCFVMWNSQSYFITDKNIAAPKFILIQILYYGCFSIYSWKISRQIVLTKKDFQNPWI